MAGRATIVIGSKTLTFSGVRNEKISLRAGLWNKNIPSRSSDQSASIAIYGRGREIVLQAHYSGTQDEIESFLLDIEQWVNEDLSFQEAAKYYPLFYPTDTSQSGTQAFYYNVLCDEYSSEYDEEEPNRINITMVLYEGTKIGPFSAESGGF